LERLIGFLDYGSRRNCRLVSQTLKAYVDDIGLSIKLDTRAKESTAISKKVVATEIRILHLKSHELEPDEIRNWKTAIFSTPVKFSYLNDHVFKYCTNLRILILNEHALTAEEFKYSAASQPFQCLSRLSELHISLTNGDFDKGRYAVKPESYDWDICSAKYGNFLAFMEARVQNNLGYLLKITRSRVLKVLFVSVHGLTGKRNAEWNYLYNTTEFIPVDNSWEHGPLFEFLQAHRHSLDTIILPALFFGVPSVKIDETLLNPIQVKRIRLGTLNCFKPRRNYLSKYWTNFLLHQESLENLSIDARQNTDEIPIPWLPALLSNNARTLTHIYLWLALPEAMDPENVATSLDMRIFLVTESLQSLEISLSRNMTIRNLNDLPTKTLRKLNLYAVIIGSDFDGIEFLRKSSLSYLFLDKVSDTGFFKDPEYTLEFIKLALRCRTLDRFEFSLAKADMNKYFPKHTACEASLMPWIAQLEADKPLSRIVDFSMESWYTGPAVSVADDTGPEWEQASGPWNYMNIVDYHHRYEEHRREPPFYLPRNMDSFTAWKNTRTQTYRILPDTDTRSPTERANDMRQFQFTVSVLERKIGRALPKPVIVEDFGTPEYFANRVNWDGSTYRFQPKNLSNFELPTPTS